MTSSVKITLYDFLNYIVIGVLSLLICNLTPDKILPIWLYLIIALLSGFIFAKLSENAFWYKWIRNTDCFILKANKEIIIVKSRIYQNSYIKDYYTLSGTKTFNTITILEAQFAFVYNLIVLLFLYSILNFNTISSITLDSISFNFSKASYCCGTIQNTTIPFNSFKPLIKVHLLLLICSFIKIICSNIKLAVKCSQNERKEGTQSNLKNTTTIVCNKCCKAGFNYLIAGTIITIIIYALVKINGNSNPLLLYIIIALILLAVIAYHLQKKISYMVVEGAYYNRKLSNNSKII
jgi:hypothetical protein